LLQYCRLFATFKTDGVFPKKVQIFQSIAGRERSSCRERNLMSFDIRQIRYVLAAADHGSFYRAARALDIEQSTLSRAIVRLERSLGAELFTRSRAGVAPTDAGLQFLRGARTMLASADRMIEASRAAGLGRAGILTIGFNTSISAGHLRATLIEAQEANPALAIEGMEADRNTLFAGMDSDAVDIAILLGEVERCDYRHATFWSERVFVALASDHALAARDIVHWTDLRDQRFILSAADPGPDIRDMLLGRLWKSGANTSIALHAVSREAVLSMIGETDFLSIVCEGSTGTQFPNLVYRPVHGEQGPALITYSGYWREDNGNPALKRFLDLVRRRYALSFGHRGEENGSE
jgi:DNA-binding transcriptional LysR family regulator